ncbi:MAG TPA: HAD family hydrolase [Burkholderiaceae bacterium]|nr:HAD family hydrolase [Burkholderiaceae bacterium]
MKPIASWPVEQRRNIVGVFTDIDDTLTTQGSITPDALQALADLKAAGLHVIPITGRPVGWATPLAEKLTVDAIVVENGAVALRMVEQPFLTENICKNELKAAYSLPKVLSKLYQEEEAVRTRNQSRMQVIAQQLLAQIPELKQTRDSAGRETDLAFDANEFAHLSFETAQQVHQLLQQAGMQTTQSSIHIHGSFGSFDKWTGAKWIVRELFQRELADELAQWVFVGDSGNDQAMFQHFVHSVGVANIRHFQSQLQHLPRFITMSERGAGFAEVAHAILSSRA